MKELLLGKGAHAGTMACVEDLSYETAAKHAPGMEHSVGQSVFHMNYWMEYELKRICGERPAYPEHASESWPQGDCPRDAPEWDGLVKHLRELLAEFDEMAGWSREELERQVESAHEPDKKLAATVESVLWQLIAHNSYHVGQIVMARQAQGAWPPRAGGDTW